MINKEDKFRSELFKLFKNDLINITDDKEILNLFKDVFLSNQDDINSEQIIDKLTNK
jgi:hypothetical protein